MSRAARRGAGRRVVVTGLGAVSAFGDDAPALMAGLREGRCGIGPIELIDAEGLQIKIAAEAKGFDGTASLDRTAATLRDRVTQMATVAASEAIAASGLDLSGEAGARTATILGCSMGGQHTYDDGYRALYAEGKARLHPFTVPRSMASAPVSWITMDHGLTGPAWTVSTACASANHAIGQAFHLVRSGTVDAAITGGAESGLSFGLLKAWEGLRVMSKTGCRPFSADRDGMVQGEGAAILVLEEMEAAKARGATIWGEVAGFGASADAGEIVQPSQDGAERAMRAALADAGLDPEAVGYVNAHGTATKANDRTEIAAIKAVFGEHAERLMVSATKSMHGHAIGAAGALEAVATLMALREGVIPPTINRAEPDPECDLDVVPGEAREARVDAALSNSFAFGGLNAVLAMRRFEG